MSDDSSSSASQPTPEKRPATKHRLGLATRFGRFAAGYNDLMFGVADWIIVIGGIYVCLTLLSEIGEKNLTVGIALIAVSTGLASSCFGYARALESSDPNRGRIIFAGERLLHGAVLAGLAAILKFIKNNPDKFPWANWLRIVGWIVEVLSGMAALTLFLSAVYFVITGLRILSRVLFMVAYSHPEWIDN